MRVALVCAVSASPSTARAQPPALPEQPFIGSAFSADLLRELPTAANPLTVLDTVQDEAIADRFVAGGLNAADPPRAGGLLNSWTQTQYRIGDVTITDPRSGGTPMLLPLLSWWDRASVGTAAMPLDDGAPALSMTLDPRRPAAAWTRAVDGSFAGSAFVSSGPASAPAIDRVDRWLDGSVAVSGPATERLGIVASGSIRSLSHVPAPAAAATTDRVASAFAHVVLAGTPSDEVRVLGAAQRVSTAAFDDSAVHAQSTWERHDPSRIRWRLFGGYTARQRTTPLVATVIVDSLTSDPISNLLAGDSGSARRWTIGGRVAPRSNSMMPALGVDLEGASTRTDPTSLAQIRELVDAAPARVWTVRGGGTVQTRHLRTLAVHGTERVTSGRLTLDAGLRVEHVSAAADAATAGIDWTSWLPRALAGWQLTTRPRVDLVASYRRAAYQLPLNVLAIGDPAAPFADVSRWNGATVGPLIARVGPGTGGDPTIARIDPQLERPLTDELVLAVRSRPFRGWEFELARVTKREQSLLAFADVGLDPRSYTSFQVPDPSVLPGTPPTPVSQPFVTVYNRPADAYGLDRYVLTNRTDDPARSWALELNVRATTERLTFVGATALTWAKGPAAAVGFLPTENDQDVVGNLFVDRNSMTGERGQLFQDRSHVGKFAVVYRFPASVAVGAIARYQDGQPFARVVVVPNLTQGPTAVRAYANGGTAFSYIATLDVRLQKTIASRYGAWTVGVDVYNLPDLHNEVSEYVVSGAAFRTPTALQPPRTVVVGLRWTF